MDDEIAVNSVRGHDNGDRLSVAVELRNDSARTMHAFRDARTASYDPITKTLHVGLVAGEATSDTSGSFLLPNFTSVDPGSSTTIELALPRFLTRLNGATDAGAPIIERIPIHEATEVTVDVAWSDTPFYPDPRAADVGKSRMVHDQLRSWQRGVAQGRGTLDRGDPKKGS